MACFLPKFVLAALLVSVQGLIFSVEPRRNNDLVEVDSADSIEGQDHPGWRMARAFRDLVFMSQKDIDAYYDSLHVMAKEQLTDQKGDEKAVAAWYNVVGRFCDLGTYEKMYIPPVLDVHKGNAANQVLFERGMADTLGASEGKQLLDLGCGKGRVAHEVASYSNAKVVGLNLGAEQIANAKRFAWKQGMLGTKLDFQRGSFNDPLPFADSSFDGAYEVGAFSYVIDKPTVFAEIYRVLKPGARFSYCDWVKVNYDPTDPVHVQLLKEVKPLTGMVNMPTHQSLEDAFKQSGFEIEFSGEASKGGEQLTKLIHELKSSFSQFNAVAKLGLFAGMLSPKTIKLFRTIGPGATSLREAVRLNLFTMSYQIVVRKPLDASQ